MSVSQDKYDVVIGLEVHAQLRTATKLFCGCPNRFGAEPNTNVCPVCMGLPGTLPVFNARALQLAIKASLAINCRVNQKSKFDRKQYFYPDLPKGYQISQYDEPIAENGFLELPDGSRVNIIRLHIEEDAGKLVHAGAERLHGSSYSLVDLNRAGTPLIEIVSAPDITNAEQAKLYVQELRLILIYCGVCDGNLEEGSLRCDINISLKPKGSDKLGTRAEIKNVNSFRSIGRAIEYEIERQAEILDSGGKVIQETRLWDEAKGLTASMRSKEEANDYRYFPDPDLMPIVLQQAEIDAIASELPPLPAQKRIIYTQQYSLNSEESYILIEDEPRGRFFDEVMLSYKGNPKRAASWLNGSIYALLKEQGLEDAFASKLTPNRMVEALNLVDDGILSDSTARAEVLPELIIGEESPGDICQRKGLKQVSDESAIGGEIAQIISEFPDQFAELKSGKDKMRAFFVGQAMKKFKGKASPTVVNKILDELIGSHLP